MTLRFPPSSLLVKPNYDVGNAKELILPLGIDNKNVTPIVWSGLAQLRVNDHIGGGDTVIDNFSRLVSNVDEIPLLNSAAGAAYFEEFLYMVPETAWVYKLQMFIGVGLSITAFTSGNVDLTSVELVIEELTANQDVISRKFEKIQNVDITPLTAVEDAVAVTVIQTDKPFKMTQGNILRFTLTVNRTTTGTNTSFTGILPFFYVQGGALSKLLFESQIKMSIQPAINSSFDVFRDESIQSLLDFGGVNREGETRGAPFQ